MRQQLGERVLGSVRALELGQVAGDRHVQVWCAQQARQLVGTPVGTALRALPHEYPIEDRSVLAAVKAPVLLIGQVEDDAHPAHVAAELAQEALARLGVRHGEVMGPDRTSSGHTEVIVHLPDEPSVPVGAVSVNRASRPLPR